MSLDGDRERADRAWPSQNERAAERSESRVEDAIARRGNVLRVLLVESSRDDAQLVLQHISRGDWRVVHRRVWSLELTKSALREGTWDFVVCENAMTDFDSFEVLRILEAEDLDVPLVIISDSMGEEAAGEAMRAGARDYLRKGDLARLRPVVERELREARNRQRQRQTEKKYRSIFENAVEGIFWASAGGDLLTVNPAMADILGYDTPEELMRNVTNIGKGIFVEPDAHEKFSEQIERAGVVHGFEATVRCKDGDYIWASLNASASHGAGGRMVGYEGFVEDITRRKLADHALRESEERYRTVVEQAADCIFLVDAETKLVLEANVAFRNLLGYSARELAETRIYDFVAHDRRSIDRNMERLLEERSLSVGERRYRRKDGQLLSVEVSASVISQAGKEVLCVVSHDVTSRKRTEESLRRSLDILLALREAGQILSATLESEEIGSRLLTIMRGVSGLTTAVIDIEDEAGRLRIWRSTGLDALPPRTRFSTEAKVARRVALETGERRLFALGQPASGDKELTGLCLPLKIQDRIVGVLEAYGPKSLVHGDAAEILSSLAVQAASALENARLYDELAEREKRLQGLVGKLFAAQEEERRRVAYEVHDGLAQVAAAAHQHLQAFARFHPPDSERGRDLLEEAQDLMQQTVGEARRVIANLRPTALDDFGLQSAIRLEAETLRANGWNISFDGRLEDDGRLPVAIETALFRVAQQALANIGRHADTRRARLSLARVRNKVRLRVRDWGRGFELDSLSDGRGPGERVGLASMRERIALLGGTLNVHSVPGTGTLVTAEVPLGRREPQDRETA